MSNKILQMKEKEISPQERAWSDIKHQAQLIHLMNIENPKALQRAGNIGKLVIAMIENIATYRAWKEQTK